MLDSNNDSEYRFSKINCIIHTNGVVESVTEDGVVINQLSGDLRILHKVAPLVYAVNRRAWMLEAFGFTYLPTLRFSVVVIYADGKHSKQYPLNTQQVFSLLKFIKN